ncbi:hypothetical protein [Desulfobotulus sp.]|uniref:hypothetical protein n=1 Tax=Desulfobotulus sp. TaxID=1940337 RepID=UPI002A36E4B0|nr:hypothetical protein [Desulfobotulus sp.]MDY0164158.1 hypothetical protein [Desulfobotulus sp.]
MEKIKASEDPEERRRLMKEHAADMKKCMEMMKTMPGCKMEKAGDDKGGMDMKTMAACQQNMAMKMDMMELVVEGTLESLKMEK